MHLRFVLAFALVATGCSNKAKQQDLDDFAAARAAFNVAQAALDAGDLQLAHVSFGVMNNHIIKVRARASRPMEETLEPGRVLEGKTAQAWQEEWTATFRAHVVDAFDALAARAAAGTLNWLDARAFFTTYGDQALDQRWQASLKQVERAHGARDPNRYQWVCRSVLDGLCEQVRAAVAPKAARPLATEDFLADEGRDAMLGVITVEFEERDRVDYHASNGEKGPGASLPTQLVLSMEVLTRRGHSNWDGHHSFAGVVAAPTAIAGDDLRTTEDKHFAALQQRLVEQLATLPAQTVE
jgi:hypothetical protein